MLVALPASCCTVQQDSLHWNRRFKLATSLHVMSLVLYGTARALRAPTLIAHIPMLPMAKAKI